MTNFQFFWKHSAKWLWVPWLPKIKLLDKPDRHLESYPDAWGYYDAVGNNILILRDRDNLAVRVHEYGHWLNARLYLFLDALWELPWWGLGLRSLLGVRKENKS